MYSHSRKAAQSAAQDVRRLLRQAALKNPEFAANGNALRLASEQLQNSSLRGSGSGNSAPQANAGYTGPPLPPGGMDGSERIVEHRPPDHSVVPNLDAPTTKVNLTL